MITVAFSAPKKWSFPSWVIRKFTKSKVSHVLIGLDILGIPMFLHCTEGGVKVSRRDHYVAANNLIHEFPILGNMQEPLRHAWLHIDDNYDYAGLIGFAWVILWWELLKRKVRNPFASTSRMWCSEFLLHLTYDHDRFTGRIPEWAGMRPEYTDPQALVDRIVPDQGSFGKDLVR